jgi:cell division protein FtsL
VEPASVDGLLADFGVSSLQFDEARRGFSFQADGPLDMRMDTRSGPTAEQVVNEMEERELANLIYEYGEERRSRTVARAIVRGRPVTTTGQLARIVASAVPPMKHIHPATRTFQALRIFVNRELDEIKACSRPHRSCLSPPHGSWLSAFILLKIALRKTVCGKARRRESGRFDQKPVTAGEEEIDRNPRSRSAKLRAAENSGKGRARRGELNMAACNCNNYFERAGRGFRGGAGGTRIAERNAELMAQQASAAAACARRSSTSPGTLTTRAWSRPATRCGCARCACFRAAVAVLFSLVMIYGLQHFYAIESSYRVESEKQTLDQLREENRQLRLSEAELTQPGRIDQMARQLGLAEPQPGQVVHPSAR